MLLARLGGRVLLVDPSDRILLIHERLEDGSTHWLTPGGGVEPGETTPEAAQREAWEEAGIRVSIPPESDPVLTTRRLWSWDGVEYDQIDEFFLARLPDDIAPRPAALTDVERQTLIEMRWWTLTELRSTDATLLPTNLGDVLVAALRAEGHRG